MIIMTFITHSLTLYSTNVINRVYSKHKNQTYFDRLQNRERIPTVFGNLVELVPKTGPQSTIIIIIIIIINDKFLL